MKGHDLLTTALEFVANTRPSDIEFGDKPTTFTRAPWRARTKCSTLITSLERLHGRAPADRVELYGRTWPRASDYHRAIVAGSGFREVKDIRDVLPGDLIAIRFANPDGGASGHCALVAGLPEQWVPGKWRVAIIDSTSVPHGALDPRATGGYQGLGKAGMMLLCDRDHVITGYQWSPTSDAQYTADRVRLVAVGRFL